MSIEQGKHILNYNSKQKTEWKKVAHAHTEKRTEQNKFNEYELNGKMCIS